MNAQQLIFGGKTYLSSREASKTYGYTQDYIGQLIRSKKVEAQFVGRSWFVSEDSLKSYLSSVGDTSKKHVDQQANQNVSDTRDVLQLQAISGGPRLSYSSDDRELLPTLSKQKPPIVTNSTSVKMRVPTPSKVSAPIRSILSSAFDRVVASAVALSLVAGSVYVADASRLEHAVVALNSFGTQMAQAITKTATDLGSMVGLVGESYLATLDHAGASLSFTGASIASIPKRLGETYLAAIDSMGNAMSDATDILSTISIPEIARSLNENSKTSLAAVGASDGQIATVGGVGHSIAIQTYLTIHSLFERTGWTSPSGPASIGRVNSPAGYYFNGTIDEVRVYTRALSDDEIKQLYVLGK